MFSSDSNGACDNNHSTFSNNILQRDSILYFCIDTSDGDKNWDSRRDLHSFTGNIDY